MSRSKAKKKQSCTPRKKPKKGFLEVGLCNQPEPSSLSLRLLRLSALRSNIFSAMCHFCCVLNGTDTALPGCNGLCSARSCFVGSDFLAFKPIWLSFGRFCRTNFKLCSGSAILYLLASQNSGAITPEQVRVSLEQEQSVFLLFFKASLKIQVFLSPGLPGVFV